MAAKRKDSKGRVLRKGEGQRSDGRYMFRYTDLCGKSRVEIQLAAGGNRPVPEREAERLIPA